MFCFHSLCLFYLSTSIIFKQTSINTGAIAFVCTYFLNMYDIILVGDDIVMYLS